MDKQISKVAKVEALYKERPWLEKCFPKNKVTQVRVKLAGLEMIRMEACAKGIFATAIDTVVRSENAPKIALLDQEGKLVCWVGPTRQGRFLAGFVRYFYRESVAQALVRLGDKANKVTFVVVSFFEELTLHKPKKGFTLLDWLARLEEEAIQSLRQEEEALD